MLLNSSNNEYVKRADGGFARGQATEDFWQKPAGSSSSHLAAGAGVLPPEDAEVAKAGAAAVCPTTAPPDTVPKKVSFQ